jgi:hypothetical protein
MHNGRTARRLFSASDARGIGVFSNERKGVPHVRKTGVASRNGLAKPLPGKKITKNHPNPLLT